MSGSSTSRGRTPLLSEEESFMAFCLSLAQQSKDPRTQVGACVVNREGTITGSGFNDMLNSSEEFPWSKNTDVEKDKYVCHAELNAIAKAAGNVRGGTIYATLFPCNECAKLIIKSGIENVVYFSDQKNDKPKFKAFRKMFEEAHINLRQLSSPKTIKLDLNDTRKTCGEVEGLKKRKRN